MKKTSTFKHIATLVIIGAIILSGCGVTVREHQNRPNRGHSLDHRRDYDNRLHNNDRRIAELRNSKHRDEVFVIEVKHNNMKKKLNEFKGNTKQDWNIFKKKFNHDMKKIEKSLNKFSKKRGKR
jgi:hypothetical protein